MDEMTTGVREVTVELLATRYHAWQGHRRRPYDPAVCDCRAWAEMVFDVIDHPDDPAWQKALRGEGSGAGAGSLPAATRGSVTSEGA